MQIAVPITHDNCIYAGDELLERGGSLDAGGGGKKFRRAIVITAPERCHSNVTMPRLAVEVPEKILGVAAVYAHQTNVHRSSPVKSLDAYRVA
jgi:hypothetical protein